MKTKYLGNIDYTGSELRHLFAFEKAGILGDSIISFFGSAQVKTHLVDAEDRFKDDFIYAPSMCHFIIEIFDCNMREIVTWQRIFICNILASLYKYNPNGKLLRKGDDLFLRRKDDPTLYKMTVSIATLSPFSGLIHTGINWEDPGPKCPVSATGLNTPSFQVPPETPESFCQFLMSIFSKEFESVQQACYKVLSVT